MAAIDLKLQNSSLGTAAEERVDEKLAVTPNPEPHKPVFDGSSVTIPAVAQSSDGSTTMPAGPLLQTDPQSIEQRTPNAMRHMADPSPEPKTSTSADHRDDAETPISPNSTTPVLEKDEPELDFAGNVDVNDDIPTEKDFRRVDDLLVLDAEGHSRPFKDLYKGDGVAPRQLIIFVRHFFCGNCQEYLRTLSSSITPESLLALPTPTFITVIGCGRPELIDMYAQTTSCPFPIYADPTRKLYDILGMTRTFDLGKKPGYIHSNLFVTSVQSIVQGIKQGGKALSGGDFKQVGGEFMFENGKCTWTHRMRNTRDHAEVEDLRRLLGLDAKRIPLRKRWSHGIKEMGKEKRSASWGRGRMRSKSRGTKDGSATPEEKEEELAMKGRPTI